MAVPKPTDPGAMGWVRERIESLVGGPNDGKAYQTSEDDAMADQYRFFAALLGKSPEVFQMCLTSNENFANFSPTDSTTHMKVIKTKAWAVISGAINSIDGLEHRKGTRGDYKSKTCVHGAIENCDSGLVNELIVAFRVQATSNCKPQPFTRNIHPQHSPATFTPTFCPQHLPATFTHNIHPQHSPATFTPTLPATFTHTLRPQLQLQQRDHHHTLFCAHAHTSK